ncbi:MAG: hypothetical protein HY935_01835 [Nitrosomonadales bacterium]|nr:hypothetical protein [Nitrosomonadales bacterium]
MKNIRGLSPVVVEKIGCCFVFVILLLLGGNSYGADVAASQVPVSLAHCPADNFENFFGAFSEQIELQKQFTQFPLKKLKVIDADPEPKPIIKSLKKNQITFPVVPNQIERKNKGLSIRLEIPGLKQAKAMLFKKDTDYQIVYFFTKNGCWMLNRIEDWSL